MARHAWMCWIDSPSAQKKKQKLFAPSDCTMCVGDNDGQIVKLATHCITVQSLRHSVLQSTNLVSVFCYLSEEIFMKHIGRE